MPIYEYECTKCGERFNLRRSFSDSDNDVKCPKCNTQNPKRVISNIAPTRSCSTVSSGG